MGFFWGYHLAFLGGLPFFFGEKYGEMFVLLASFEVWGAWLEFCNHSDPFFWVHVECSLMVEHQQSH